MNVSLAIGLLMLGMALGALLTRIALLGQINRHQRSGNLTIDPPV